MLRVGRISYLNVEPFFHAFPWPIAESLPPRALGEAVAAGRIDAGPLAQGLTITRSSSTANN